MIAGWFVILAALVYLSALFAIAHFGDLYGERLHVGRARSSIYALTLAVYCTSWTFFGSVGLASSTGFDFLAIYIGPILMIGLGHNFVRRIVRLAKTQNILSVSDFVSARYGKSGRVAAIVAIIAVIGSIPYIALQLKAITVSLRTLLEAVPGGVGGLSTPAFGTLALMVALVLAAFTVTFGTRHIDSREHHTGLSIAIASESAIKLAAFLAAGIFVVWGMFGGLSALVSEVMARADVRPLLDRSGGFASVLAMTGLSTAIILLLPRQFHMTIVENRDESDTKRAAWMFPLYLVLINLFVIPIALASDLVFPPGMIDRDMAILELPLKASTGLIALVVFIGGLSASTAMVIVECVALATMISNDLVMPLLLSEKTRILGARPGDLGGQVLAVRRLAIVIILLAGYSYFRSTSDAALASIGLISFTAIAQIAPSFFGGLFWRKGTALGAMAGLISGLAVWAYTLILPTLANPAAFGLDELIRNGPFGLALLKPTALFGTTLVPIAHGAFFSLGVNILCYIGFSLLRAPTPIEKLQANLFVSADNPLRNLNFRRWRSTVTIGELKRVVGRYLGVDRAEAAFASYPAPSGIDDQPADLDVLRFAEHQLASAIGAASSRRVLSMMLSGGNVSQSDALRLLDDASAALQHNRDLLQHALDHARQGVTVFDTNLHLLCWNREFQMLFELPDSLMRVGTSLNDIVAFNARRGLYGKGRAYDLITARLESFVNDTNPVRLKLYPEEQTIEIRSAHLPDGGIVTTYTDITETVAAEDALARANESLEGRVRERTEELLRLNGELSRAKSEADEANLSKTRFLAAASHDILQPLNAARLYASALLDRGTSTGNDQLVQNVASSLEAVEDILTTLLDISRLDAGAMKPELSTFALDDVFNQLRIELAPLAEEKGIELRFVKTALSVRSDRRLLRRLLQNLISNAIKYTPHGRVLVGCRRIKGKIRIDVYDTGLGIPLAQQKSIFREFKRLDDGAKIARGLGLGLSIVERIARLLKHPLKLKSEPGQGSHFSIEVPVGDRVSTTRKTTTPHRDLSAPLAGLKILVIDNEPAILDAMNNLLSGWGCIIHTASGIKAAEAFHTDLYNDIDVIIADYHLDDGTGIDAIAHLRRQSDRMIPAILATADRSEPVRIAAAAADVTLVHKPLKPAGLRALLSQWRATRFADATQ